MPVPYAMIRMQLWAGKVIPFLGAGASLLKRDPLGTPWVTSELNPPEDKYHHAPTADELTEYLANLGPYPGDSPRDLAKVAQYHSVVHGREGTRDVLQKIFASEFPFLPIHEYLAEVQVPLLIVTTNYDDLIERAFHAKGRRFHVVVDKADIGKDNKLRWAGADAAPAPEPWWKGRQWKTVTCDEITVALADELKTTSIIYKMHGAPSREVPPAPREDEEDGNFVISEDDYADFIVRLGMKTAFPDLFADPFQTRHFLFLGYGLRDWNMRVALRQIEQGWGSGREEESEAKEARKSSRGRASWAIQHSATQAEDELWKKRNVQIYEESLDDFVRGLRGPR